MRLRFLATHDPLTNLPNRTLFDDRLAQAIADAKRENSLVAVLFLDLDDFKNINDAFGHDKGDYTLVQIANNLKKTIREQDTIARIGGDEFLILINLSDAIVKVKALTQIGQKITESITSPLKIQDHEFELGISIGAGIYPSDVDNLSELIKLADKAMYYSKDQGSVMTFIDEINH